MKTLCSTLLVLLACGVWTLMEAAPRPPAATQIGEVSSTMSGTLIPRGGKFFLTDDTTRASVEVRGMGLQKYAGSKVKVTGVLSPGSGGSQQILTLSQVSRVATAGLGGGKAAAAGVKTGLSKAAVVGIAGGATAGTVGTLYAAEVIGGEEAPVSRK